MLLRIFLGGACQSELNALPDGELRSIVAGELKQLLEARGEPLFSEVIRWPNAMPQYHVGHCERVAAIDAALSVYQDWSSPATPTTESAFRTASTVVKSPPSEWHRR